MFRKTLILVVALAAMLPVFLPTQAEAAVPRVTLVEDFGFFT
jgi:hypothetical protein